MDCDEEDNSAVSPTPGEESQSAVNSLILDYYKKFGRKRDLEQYFSLSTAQSDIRDPSNMFWSRLKTEAESSDSGERSEKKSESSQELCRISIRFPAPDPNTSQEEKSKTKSDSVSPPIIIEEVQESRHNSEDEGTKSDDNNSQKSYDVHLDTSMNKPHSPSSSITSQRKLEWDSLADVGYGNESDRKTSASSLSTLERLALKQQYSNNDTHQDSNLGPPTAHSTPLDENESKSKNKKGISKKSTKIYKKDIDVVEVNVPHSSNMNPTQSINVNLTKHISFNVEKDGNVTVENVQKDISVSPEKVSVETEMSPRVNTDKDVQTSLTKAKESNLSSIPENVQSQSQTQKIPILISLNTLRNRARRKKLRLARRKLKHKKKADKENIPVQEKSGEPLSEAESFEYMPGHIYNQNQMTANERSTNATDNKSSLESSGVLTTDSSKGSKHSFSKDLEKSIDILKAALQQRCDDSNLRKNLIKQVCQRLLKSKYRDDDSSTDFLSGLSFSSKKLGLDQRNNTTTSTSDANNTTETPKRPKKSILRSEKFNPGSIASTSQSVPNLPVASNSEILVSSNLAKNVSISNTDTDMSSKEKSSSDNVFAKTSSEELYQKYLQALKREEAYKRHLKDKETFLKQKLVSSDSAFKVPVKIEVKPNNRLKDLINDLTRNNYDDGSGDASKLEGGPGSNRDFDRYLPNRSQRSHSVFTLSSGNSDKHNKKPNLKKRLHCDLKDLAKPGPSNDMHYCCCPHHSGNSKVGVTDSSVQVNINNPCSNECCPARHPIKVSPREEHKVDSPKNMKMSDDTTRDIKYVCLCSNKTVQDASENFLIYKCSRLTKKGNQLEDISSKSSYEGDVQCNNYTCSKRNTQNFLCTSQASTPINNKSSQTNMLIKMLHQQSGNLSLACSDDKKDSLKSVKLNDDNVANLRTGAVYEATRCIQTEISINPKISEPTLSDIHIVNDDDCAQVISRNYREISKPSSTDVYNRQDKGSTQSANSDSYKSSGTSKAVDKELENESNFGAITENPENQNMNIEHSENFTIPIQGTNMTLMVKIGSERKVYNMKKPEDAVTQGIGTDRANVTEQGTCLTEECSKSVQFNTLVDDSVDHNRNKIKNDYEIKNKTIETVNNPCTVNTCLTADDNKFGTYPKTSPVNDRKIFRRANTDTDRDFNVQPNMFNIDNVRVERRVPIESQSVNQTQKKCKCGCSHSEGTCSEKCIYYQNDLFQPPSYKAKLCSCGCPHSEDTCKGKCKDNADEDQICHKDKSIKDGIKQTTYKQDKCLCGCEGDKDNCKEKCPECKSTLRSDRKLLFDKSQFEKVDDLHRQNEPCGGIGGIKDNCKENSDKLILTPRTILNLSLDKQLCRTKDLSDNQSEKCSCGCNFTKDKCKKDCSELKCTSKGQSINHTHMDKKIRGECGIPDNHREDCPCGCGGKKDKCEKDCFKNNTVREQYRKLSLEHCKTQSMDKGISTRKELSEKQTETCPCGCGGTIDNCNKDCIELKKPKDNYRKHSLDQCKKQTTTSTQKYFSDTETDKCPCGCGGTKDNCKKDCIELKKPKDNYRKQSQGQCAKQTINKEISTQKNFLDKESVKCPCGCGGINDSCKKDCTELKSSPKELIPSRKQSIDRKVDTSQDFSDDSNHCPCGCDGNISDCKKDCIERKKRSKKEVGTQKYLKEAESPRGSDNSQIQRCASIKNDKINDNVTCILRSAETRGHDDEEIFKKPFPKVDSRGEQTNFRNSDRGQKSTSETEQTDTDPILNMIQNITNKYTKKEIEKSKRKKCFKEIMAVLNYLLETDDPSEQNEDRRTVCDTTTTADETDAGIRNAPEKTIASGSGKKVSERSSPDKVSKKDKSVQLSSKKSKGGTCITDSSDLPISTDIPGTSSDSATCKVLNKIKKECERYHQKRCKIHSSKKCEGNSTTSVSCDQCKRIHHCSCRHHKCKGNKKSNEKISKSPVAYNLILQTSESVISDGTVCEKNHQLQNIIVKVPKKKPVVCMPFKEMAAKFERNMHCSIPCGVPCSSKDTRSCRSRSLPNESEITSMEEIIRKSQGATVREYLEKNRPDFVERSSQRQTCLKYISESRCDDSRTTPNLKMVVVHTPNCPGNCNSYNGGIPNVQTTCMSNQCFEPRVPTTQTGVVTIGGFCANERAVKRDLLSMHVAQLPDVTDLDSDELQLLAKELGRRIRHKQPAPKFISEREMKKHSEKIYKSLPEVVQKKEEKKKENIKKTNLLMASMFKKNLQKKTLRGSVNLSNYSTVIKI